jgi:hypothetical protein
MTRQLENLVKQLHINGLSDLDWRIEMEKQKEPLLKMTRHEALKELAEPYDEWFNEVYCLLDRVRSTLSDVIKVDEKRFHKQDKKDLTRAAREFYATIRPLAVKYQFEGKENGGRK